MDFNTCVDNSLRVMLVWIMKVWFKFKEQGSDESCHLTIRLNLRGMEMFKFWSGVVNCGRIQFISMSLELCTYLVHC
jgi:hypothetical protein